MRSTAIFSRLGAACSTLVELRTLTKQVDHFLTFVFISRYDLIKFHDMYIDLSFIY